ncbi:roadblock/LC7 domain-containing protein [Actinomadura sp. NPDC048394]|uniref:roadblock/LC7 domain-containing protein n=1 Tax=Actinomadura sp. NPDC048394 TaxID=3158223 RepID=UPI003405B15B
MTIPPASAVSSSAAPVGPPVSRTPAGEPGQDLGWLLDNFRVEVPGIQAAFLLTRDGLVLAASGLTTDEADHAAAVAAALYSPAAAAGKITSPHRGDVQQVIVEHDDGFTILMNTPGQDLGLPADRGPTVVSNLPTPQAGPAVVGCVLGVLAGPDAQTGLVADGMAMLIESVARHMVAATRTSTPGADAAAAAIPTPNAPGEGSGRGEGGRGDE